MYSTLKEVRQKERDIKTYYSGWQLCEPSCILSYPKNNKGQCKSFDDMDKK